MSTTSSTAHVSEAAKPDSLLQPSSTTPKPSVYTQEDFMRFAIGLRMLGEERSKRFLTYLATIVAESQARKEARV